MPYKDPEVKRKADRELKRRRRRENPEHERELRRVYYRRHVEEIAQRNLISRSRERYKATARTAVRRALASGVLVRGKCEIGSDCFGAIEAHHDDYHRPLDVRWFCKAHHAQLHVEILRRPQNTERDGETH